jgi:beta-alanine--pyruvate transaminase
MSSTSARSVWSLVSNSTPRPGAPTARAMELFHACFDDGLLVRATGDIIALSPPLIVEKAQIDEMFGKISDLLDGID